MDLMLRTRWKKMTFWWLRNYVKCNNCVPLLLSCVLLRLDLNLRGSRPLRPRPQVCELCQAWDCWSLSLEPGRDGERRPRPHSSRSQPVHVSLWGRAGRRNELRDFLLTLEKRKEKERIVRIIALRCARQQEFSCVVLMVHTPEDWRIKTPMKC